MGTIFVGSILLLAVGSIIINMIHKKKLGKSSCGCSGCNGSCDCHCNAEKK